MGAPQRLRRGARREWLGGHCDDARDHRAIVTLTRDPDGEGATGYSDQTTFFLPDLPDGDRIGSLDPRDWVTYLHAHPTARGGIMLQYWHTFAFNDFPGDDHGGDWDAEIQVELDEQLALRGIWFSRHLDDSPGTFFAADGSDPRYGLSFVDGTHPMVTIDGGGHAAFASPLDWCVDPHTKFGVRASDIAWTTQPDDPATLRTIDCGAFSSWTYGDDRGGTIWQTWTGGQVLQGGPDVDSRIVSPSPHGGLINLGEYNPCTPATCQGARQASTLLAGQLLPMNGQVFIAYGGRWGSLGTIINGPRGPVFQGYAEGVYTAWYNQGADGPATAATSPWRSAPGASLIVQPLVTVNEVGFTTPGATGTIESWQSAIADRFGTPLVESRVYPLVGTSAPDYAPYLAPFTIVGPDGAKVIQYRVTDTLGNSVRSFDIVVVDSTPPVTTAALTPLAPDGRSGWYRQDVTVSLAATDPRPPSGSVSSGVVGTWYRVNRGPWRPYAGSFTVTAEGAVNLVDSYSVDAMGNTERLPLPQPDVGTLFSTFTPGMALVPLDKTRPRITLLGGEVGGKRWSPSRLASGATTHQRALTLDCEASDNLALQEVRAVEATRRTGTDADVGIVYDVQDLSAGAPLTEAPCSLHLRLEPGRNRISLIAEDAAGWRRATPVDITYTEATRHPTTTPKPTAKPTRHQTTAPKPTAKPTLTPLDVTIEVVVERACNDFYSHELGVSWHVSGGDPPIHATLRVGLPEGVVESREADGRTSSWSLHAEVREGGVAVVKVRAEDGRRATGAAKRDVHLEPCG